MDGTNGQTAHREGPAVVIDSVTMKYRVPSADKTAARNSSLAARLVRRVLGQQPTVSVQALNELTLVVDHGESVGIIGRNGSGKSTLTKLISGQANPTTGAIFASSVPVMLGVNAALVPELSGDQNVVLGCLAMGMSRRQINERFDSIIEMSGLEQKIYLPMRSYSSGMASRLRFAIAASVNPEILLIDEALNTGDAQFRIRSKQRMDELRAQAGCVFLVSHSLSTITDNCSRGIWLDQGNLIMDSDAASVTEAYRAFTNDLARGRIQQAAKFRSEIAATLQRTVISPATRDETRS